MTFSPFSAWPGMARSPEGGRRSRLQRGVLLNGWGRERASREDKRLDHNGHGPRGSNQAPDVDVVELLELDPVDRHHGVGKAHLLLEVYSEQPSHIAVED